MEGKKSCPFHMGKLLPNAEDRAAKVMGYRKAILGDAERFVTEDLKERAEGSAFHDDMRVSLGSVFLNYFWERIKEEPILKEKVKKDEDFWLKILVNALGQSYDAVYRYYVAVLNDYNDAVFTHRSSGLPISFSDCAKVNMVRGRVNRLGKTSEDKELGFPIFGDLFKFCFRFFQVVYDLLKEQLPAEQVDGVFKKYLAGEDLSGLLQQFMNNDKDTARSITRKLVDEADAENVTRFVEKWNLKKRGEFFELLSDDSRVGELSRFNKDKFVFDLEKSRLLGSKSLAGDIGIVRFIYRSTSHITPERRNCPALYTGMWPQMYDWARRLVMYQMYDEPYPTPADLPETRLEKVQPDLVARFRIGVRESLAKSTGPEAAKLMGNVDFVPYKVII